MYKALGMHVYYYAVGDIVLMLVYTHTHYKLEYASAGLCVCVKPPVNSVSQEVLFFPAMKPDDNKTAPLTEGTSV